MKYVVINYTLIRINMIIGSGFGHEDYQKAFIAFKEQVK